MRRRKGLSSVDSNGGSDEEICLAYRGCWTTRTRSHGRGRFCIGEHAPATRSVFDVRQRQLQLLVCELLHGDRTGTDQWQGSQLPGERYGHFNRDSDCHSDAQRRFRLLDHIPGHRSREELLLLRRGWRVLYKPSRDVPVRFVRSGNHPVLGVTERARPGSNAAPRGALENGSAKGLSRPSFLEPPISRRSAVTETRGVRTFRSAEFRRFEAYASRSTGSIGVRTCIGKRNKTQTASALPPEVRSSETSSRRRSASSC